MKTYCSLKILISIFAFCFQIVSAQEAPSDYFKSDTLNNTDEFQIDYKIRKKSQIAGSVSIIQNKQLGTIPMDNVINQMQGLIPGLTVIGNGQPGETSGSFIRGISTFSGSTPLFIVDGVAVDDISLINPFDVESVAVLKDASSTAIYGGRALNGVIVISTKKAPNGFHIRYNTSMGLQFPGKGTADEVLNTQELADLQWLVYKNDNRTETHPLYGASTNPKPVLPYWAGNTDWFDVLTAPALSQNHDFSVSAGSENAKIYLGTNYFDRDGIILNTDTKRYSVRLNSELAFFKQRFKIGENINFAERNGRYVPNLSDKNPILEGPYRSPSIIPVYITEPVTFLTNDFQPGDFGGSRMAPRLGNSINVVADQIRNKDDYKTDQQLTGNIYADLMIFKGLNWRTSYGSTVRKTESIDYSLSTYENAENLDSPFHTETFSKQSSWILTSFLDFERKFGNHNLNLLAGSEMISGNNGKFESLTKSGVVPDSGLIRSRTGYGYVPEQLISVFLDADYTYKNKYFVNASLRFDEVSSNRSTNYYPSFSVGWKISNETFMNRIEWLNELKLRGSYGKTGYLRGSFIKPVSVFDDRSNNAFMTSLGFDTKLFSHFELVFDWFYTNSRGIILEHDSRVSGSPNFYYNADMKNSGFEALINFNRSFASVRLNTSLNISMYQNEIGSADNLFFDQGLTRIGYAVRNQQGHPISSFYGYQVSGLFSSVAEIAATPQQDGAQQGFFRYVDQNGDNRIDSRDETFLGNPHPEFTAGASLGLSYKRFDLGVLLYWVQGNEIYNINKWWTDFWPSFSGQKSKRLLYESWTENNKSASVPKASNTSNFSTNTVNNSYYIENGSYLRMKSLLIGYTVDGPLLKRLKISHLRIFLQGLNLFTLTHYSGLDPEIGGFDTSFGIDGGNYPNVRQLLIGINLGIN